MSETWRPVLGYEGYYEVSDRGRVRSLARRVPSRWPSGTFVPERILTPTVAWTGHLRVNLSRDGSCTFVSAHVLVLEAFVGPRPPGLFGCHNDGDPANNALSNLRWDTPSSNTQDCLRHGTHWQIRKTHCRHGHPYDEENTRRRPDGSRLCRACHRESERRRRVA